MGSPAPEILKLIKRNHHRQNDQFTTREQLEDLYKASYRKFIEGFNIQNPKVRYYCNKTMILRQPLMGIIDELVVLREKALAYVPQDPESHDHFLLEMMVILIQKIVNTINWKKLESTSFWSDFCRENRQLRYLIEQAKVTCFDCCHTVTDKGNRATEILRTLFPNQGKRKQKLDPRLQESMSQSNDADPPPQGFDAMFVETQNEVLLQWLKPEENEVHTIKLSQIPDHFQLRLLRLMIYYARKSLESIIFTLSRIDLALRSEFPLDKLTRCQGLIPTEVLPHEKTALLKAKRDFDSVWNNILTTIFQMRLQLLGMTSHQKIFKWLAKNPRTPVKLNPLELISVQMTCPLIHSLFGSGDMDYVVSDKDSNLVISIRRTEDVIDIIHDMWDLDLDKSNWKVLDMLVMLLYSALSQVCKYLTDTEEKDMKQRLTELILVQRDRTKKYLKKALAVFTNHAAFYDMQIQKKRSSKQSKRKQQHPSRTTVTTSNGSVSDSSSDDERAEEDTTGWVELAGGYSVSLGPYKEFLVHNQFKDRRQFRQLMEEEQIGVTNKIIAQLLHCIGVEVCMAKILLERALETKSLVKRLNPSEKTNEILITAVTNGANYVKNGILVMKAMNALLRFTR